MTLINNIINYCSIKKGYLVGLRIRKSNKLTKLTEHYKIGQIEWYVYRHMLMPIPGPHIPINPDIKEISRIVYTQNLFGAVWTYDWDCELSPWYWIICDDNEYDLKKLSTYDRRDARRGLKRTEVLPCSLEWIAENGYEVYKKAFTRYKYSKPKDYQGFYNDLFKLSDVAKAEGWCVFCKKKLIAWLSIYLRDNTAFADDLKFDPEFRSSYPSNAVFYVITRHYLLDKGYGYITAGARNVHHLTMVQDFLVRCMGWRKAFCRLGLWLRPEIRLPLSLGFGKLSKLIQRFPLSSSIGRNVETADFLWQISHACKLKRNP